MMYTTQESKKIKDILGITKFIEAGYTGRGITFVELENDTTHAANVLAEFRNVAPDARAELQSSSCNTAGDKASGKLVDISLPYILRNRIDIFGSSTGGSTNKMINDIFQECIDNGSIGGTSAGNDGDTLHPELKGFAKADVLLAIGIVECNFDKGTAYQAKYSSRGKELDLVVFSVLGRIGTSFAWPVFAGMVALLQQFFMEKAGRKLNQSQLMEFVVNHVVDLGKIGFDEKYGYGLFVLPEPQMIDIKKYIEEVSILKLDITKYPTAAPVEWLVFSHPWQDRISKIFAGRMAYFAKVKNKKLPITSGFRSTEEQINAANDALAEHSDYYQGSDGAVYNSNGQRMVSAPGNSSHNWGIAADSWNTWMEDVTNAELEKYGLRKPMDYEPWHVEPIETKGATIEAKRNYFYQYMKEEYPMDLKTFQMVTGLLPDGISGTNTVKKAQEVLECVGEIMEKSNAYKAPGISVNGVRLNEKMDVVPVAFGGRIFAPVRFIAEALGKTVGYDSATNTALIK